MLRKIVIGTISIAVSSPLISFGAKLFIRFCAIMIQPKPGPIDIFCKRSLDFFP